MSIAFMSFHLLPPCHTRVSKQLKHGHVQSQYIDENYNYPQIQGNAASTKNILQNLQKVTTYDSVSASQGAQNSLPQSIKEKKIITFLS